MKTFTAKQINKKYAGRYVKLMKTWDNDNDCWIYAVYKSYPTIHEDTTRGEDVGTYFEYRR